MCILLFLPYTRERLTISEWRAAPSFIKQSKTSAIFRNANNETVIFSFAPFFALKSFSPSESEFIYLYRRRERAREAAVAVAVGLRKVRRVPKSPVDVVQILEPPQHIIFLAQIKKCHTLLLNIKIYKMLHSRTRQTLPTLVFVYV